VVEFAKTVVLAAIRVSGSLDSSRACKPPVTLAGNDKAQHLFEKPPPAPAHGLETCPVANTTGTHNPSRMLYPLVALTSQCAAPERESEIMTLRIDRHALGKQVVLQLLGNLRSEHLDELKQQIKAAGPDMVLDVGAVALISVEGVRLLNSCEDDGIAIKNASPYISEWMALERNTSPNGP